jgi:phospholipase/carboxylesterase
VFWGRGRYDTVIPADYVERTMEWLRQHSTLTARYEMGHTDSVAELADVAASSSGGSTRRAASRR